jgi:hypothetical protein
MARLNVQLFVDYDAFLTLDSASNAFAALSRAKVGPSSLSTGPEPRTTSRSTRYSRSMARGSGVYAATTSVWRSPISTAG